MRINLRFMTFLLLVAGLVAFTACSGGGDDQAGDSETMEMDGEHTGPEYTSAYVCPMHCKGSGSDEPGKCPECGMAYVAKDELQQREGHQDHGHDDHEEHNH